MYICDFFSISVLKTLRNVLKVGLTRRSRVLARSHRQLKKEPEKKRRSELRKTQTRTVCRCVPSVTAIHRGVRRNDSLLCNPFVAGSLIQVIQQILVLPNEQLTVGPFARECVVISTVLRNERLRAPVESACNQIVSNAWVGQFGVE